MIKGSHNSWTYLRPRKWWQRLISWTAQCQDKTITEQYKAGVRCFDLRIKRGKKGGLCIAHGLVEYEISEEVLHGQLSTLDLYGGVSIRVLHEIRREEENTPQELNWFRDMCSFLECRFTNIKFFCGRNLIDWQVDYFFGTEELSIEDAYGSVRKPKTIFALFPRLYEWLYNKIEIERGTDKDVLLMDFV